jgi:uncharacterized membrane protein (DUF485 family)
VQIRTLRSPLPVSRLAVSESQLQTLARTRMRLAVTLTLGMIVLYFGFVLLIAFNKPLLGSLLRPGLSLGILLGALVIVLSWILTWIYVRWANAHYDRLLREIKR